MGRAAGERGKNEGVWEEPRFRSLADSLAFFFSLASVFDRHHRLRAWNRLTAPARCILLTISLSNLSVKELTFTNVSEVFFY